MLLHGASAHSGHPILLHHHIVRELSALRLLDISLGVSLPNLHVPVLLDGVQLRYSARTLGSFYVSQFTIVSALCKAVDQCMARFQSTLDFDRIKFLLFFWAGAQLPFGGSPLQCQEPYCDLLHRQLL